jgi:hypothetical protein
MREIRPYGSEGGGNETFEPPYPITPDMPGASVAPPGLRGRFASRLRFPGFHPGLWTDAPPGLRKGTTPESRLSLGESRIRHLIHSPELSAGN